MNAMSRNTRKTKKRIVFMWPFFFTSFARYVCPNRSLIKGEQSRLRLRVHAPDSAGRKTGMHREIEGFFAASLGPVANTTFGEHSGRFFECGNHKWMPRVRLFK
jgi:hypothetical protein